MGNRIEEWLLYKGFEDYPVVKGMSPGHSLERIIREIITGKWGYGDKITIDYHRDNGMHNTLVHTLAFPG